MGPWEWRVANYLVSRRGGDKEAGEEEELASPHVIVDLVTALLPPDRSALSGTQVTRHSWKEQKLHANA